MGARQSSSQENAEEHQEIIDQLNRDNPELLAHLEGLVDDELKRKYFKDDIPMPAAAVPAFPQGVLKGGVPDLAPFARMSPMPPAEIQDQLSDYCFPFENLILEGGGGKGRIYGGAMRCLKDAGIKMKRFAGASAGAMTATLLAVNTPLDEIENLMSMDLKSILTDHSYGWFSIVPNLLRYFGWNRGDKFMDFFGEVMEKSTGDKDITFEGVYNKFGNELCIIGVNTNLQAVEYFHVKTTPKMSVRLAVRISMSIPGFFAAVPYTTGKDSTDYYVDGGVLCNYPIHVFDGWWLSMKPEDSFYKRLRPLSDLPKLLDVSNRFGAPNDKTLGFLVYNSGEEEIMQADLEKRMAEVHVARPNTALFRKRQAALKGWQKPMLAHAILTGSADRFFDALRDANISNDSNARISKNEMKQVFTNLKKKGANTGNQFSLTDAHLLFGKDFDIDKIFDSLDLNHDGVIDFSELCQMVDGHLEMNRRFLGYARREINTFLEFGSSLLDALQLNAKKIYAMASDLHRTIGLNTDYIGTMDFTIDPADQQFLTEVSIDVITKSGDINRFLRQNEDNTHLNQRFLDQEMNVVIVFLLSRPVAMDSEEKSTKDKPLVTVNVGWFAESRTR